MEHSDVKTSSPSSHPFPSTSQFKNTLDISSIPPEIFYHILENLPKNSLASVACTSSSFKEVSEKIMYRRVELTSIPQALQCFQVLSKRPSVAQSVREFIIMINGARNKSTEFGPYLRAALRSFTLLTALHLAIDGPYAFVLDGCTFPHLVTFSSIVDLSPNWEPVSKFLTRHSSITTLCIGGESPGQPFRLPPEALPMLRAYMGSRRIAPLVIPERPVNRITLAWHAPNVELEVDQVVPAIALSSGPVQSFSCATPGWSSALIRSVAKHLPKVQSLRFHNVSVDFHNEADLYAVLTDILSSFVNLTRLETPAHKTIKSIFSPDSESQAAKVWQNLAPQLSTVVFPSSRVWSRSSNGSWVQIPRGR